MLRVFIFLGLLTFAVSAFSVEKEIILNESKVAIVKKFLECPLTKESAEYAKKITVEVEEIYNQKMDFLLNKVLLALLDAEDFTKFKNVLKTKIAHDKSTLYSLMLVDRLCSEKDYTEASKTLKDIYAHDKTIKYIIWSSNILEDGKRQETQNEIRAFAKEEILRWRALTLKICSREQLQEGLQATQEKEAIAGFEEASSSDDKDEKILRLKALLKKYPSSSIARQAKEILEMLENEKRKEEANLIKSQNEKEEVTKAMIARAENFAADGVLYDSREKIESSSYVGWRMEKLSLPSESSRLPDCVYGLNSNLFFHKSFVDKFNVDMKFNRSSVNVVMEFKGDGDDFKGTLAEWFGKKSDIGDQVNLVAFRIEDIENDGKKKCTVRIENLRCKINCYDLRKYCLEMSLHFPVLHWQARRVKLIGQQSIFIYPARTNCVSAFVAELLSKLTPEEEAYFKQKNLDLPPVRISTNQVFTKHEFKMLDDVAPLIVAQILKFHPEPGNFKARLEKSTITECFFQTLN